MKVKICGIRSIEVAQVAINAGADFLGFNFVHTSPRYIDPLVAKTIFSHIKGQVQIVGIFQNAPVDYVNEIASSLALDYVQLHGQEDLEYEQKITTPIIKMLRSVLPTRAAYVLIEGSFNTKNIQVPIFIAGGLNAKNVRARIRTLKPYAVDVARGVETDGITDVEKIKEFVKQAKGVIV